MLTKKNNKFQKTARKLVFRDFPLSLYLILQFRKIHEEIRNFYENKKQIKIEETIYHTELYLRDCAAV